MWGLSGGARRGGNAVKGSDVLSRLHFEDRLVLGIGLAALVALDSAAVVLDSVGSELADDEFGVGHSVVHLRYKGGGV